MKGIISEQDRNIAVTKALFEAFGAKDIPAIMEFLHPNAMIEFYGTPVIPYAGTYRGHDECRRFFERVLSSVDVHRFDAEEFIAERDKVVVTGLLNLTARSTGRPIASDFVHVITLKDARWIRFRDFMNTAIAVAAFSQADEGVVSSF
ncbi:MAG: nuclear transport factor 2 family protein [Alphaproteobacteria bacterium]|mgnify:CR=1 FL=1|nr:nuclear transport factor 2 family protein [Alphaproteobacteria bacterium]MDX5416683.1 nuclear transport factor 2 family protein [Alphaproteobacteria bacterium]MDX5494065.1 nuclear transport factor 2 family protein [Alphaproteobacteria bacterium]